MLNSWNQLEFIYIDISKTKSKIWCLLIQTTKLGLNILRNKKQFKYALFVYIISDIERLAV